MRRRRCEGAAATARTRGRRRTSRTQRSGRHRGECAAEDVGWIDIDTKLFMTYTLYPRPGSRARSRRGARGGTLLGVFVGLALGIGLAAAVAYYLGRSGLTTPLAGPPAIKEAARNGKPEGTVAAPEKPRFDFYKILPGGEEPR